MDTLSLRKKVLMLRSYTIEDVSKIKNIKANNHWPWQYVEPSLGCLFLFIQFTSVFLAINGVDTE